MADLAYLGGGLGAGLVLIGAAYGIGKLASAALEGGSRQENIAGHLRITMIIAAALIEGLAFFGLVICLLLALKEPAAAPEAGHAKPAAAAPAAPDIR